VPSGRSLSGGEIFQSVGRGRGEHRFFGGWSYAHIAAEGFASQSFEFF
jgi:hypothetical protein